MGIDYNNPQTLNRYSYCANNPLNRTDPTGHSFGSFFKSVVNFAAAHPVIAALAVVLVVSAVIIAAPVVLSAISTAACITAASTAGAVSSVALSVGVATSTAAAAIVPTAAAIASIPVFGALATTVADIGLGMVGLPCANPESIFTGGSGNVSFNTGGETEVHGNSLLTTEDCYGYALRDRTTGEILKYGDTLYPDTRYTQSYLDSIQAYMDVMAQGSKAEMHLWQHDQIVDYLNSCGQLPPYNNSEW